MDGLQGILDPLYLSSFNGGRGGGGGVRNTTFHEKNHFSIFLFFFVCFTMSSSEADSGKMKTNCKNAREVFFRTGWRTKTSLSFCNGATTKENLRHLRDPFFHILNFPLQSRSCRSCYGQLGMNLEKPKVVFVQKIPIYNNLLQFSPRWHYSREKHVCSDPFFAENRSIFHGRKLQILWEWWLFFAETVKPTSETYWDDLSYLFRGVLCKRVRPVRFLALLWAVLGHKTFFCNFK
jgi:hypothetical protein